MFQPPQNHLLFFHLGRQVRLALNITPIITLTVHNVLFVQFEFLPTEQAETIYVLIYHLTYICLSLSYWKANMIFEETVTFKL